MSTTSNNGGRAAAGPTGASAARPAAKPARRRHTAGGGRLGQQASALAQRQAAAILEVLAGVRTPAQAAQALAVSLPRYFQLEARALQALVVGCEPRPRGPGGSAARELAALRRQQERLERELSRQQALVRLAQRTVGLAPPKAAGHPSGGPAKGSKRRPRRPVVRALGAAEALQRRSQEAPRPEEARAAAMPEGPTEG
jgi:hypothetical protein